MNEDIDDRLGRQAAKMRNQITESHERSPDAHKGMAVQLAVHLQLQVANYVRDCKIRFALSR